MFGFNIMGFSAMYTLISESFPTEIRSIGVAFCSCCGRIGGILTPIITGLVLEYNNGFRIAIIIFSSLLLLNVTAFSFLKETRTLPRPSKLIPAEQ